MALASAAFHRSYCEHGALFRPEYTRSNRNRGTKILRCFPHCCPLHVDRSYCGSPLEMQLTLSPGYDDHYVDRLMVFARFEPAGDVPEDDAAPQGGQLESTSSSDDPFESVCNSHPHSLEWLQRQSQSADNPTGAWIEAKRCIDATPSDDRGDDRSRRRGNDSTVTFVLNGSPDARWYYHWESGANKSQRTMRHVLRAFVYQHNASLDEVSSDALRLVGVVRSPTFTIVSYRRAAPIVDDGDVVFDESVLSRLGSDSVAGANIMDTSNNVDLDEEKDSHKVPLRYTSAAGQPIDYRLHQLIKRNIFRAFRNYRSGQSAPELAAGSKRSRSDRGFALARGGYQASIPRDSAGNKYFRDTGGHSRTHPLYQPDVLPERTHGLPSSIRQEHRRTSVTRGHGQVPDDLAEKLLDLSVVHLCVTHPDLIKTGSFTSPTRMRRIQQVSTEQWGYDWGLHDILKAVCSERTATRSRQEDYSSLSRGRRSYYTDSRSGGDHSSFLDTLHDAHFVERDGLAHLLVEISIWAFSKDNYSGLSRLLRRLSDDMRLGDSRTFLHNAEAAFSTCVVWCWTRLDEFLASRRVGEEMEDDGRPSGRESWIRSLRITLVREIFRDTRYDSLQQSLTEIFGRLEGSGERYGWRAFVAQLRETFIRAGPQPPSRRAPSMVDRRNNWNGDWHLQPDSVQIRQPPTFDGPNDSLSVWTVCEALSQLVRFETRIDHDHSTVPSIKVRSRSSILSDDETGWAEFVCDNHPRVARVFPNGRSTMSTTLLAGDYVASPLAHGSMRLRLYWWPVGSQSEHDWRATRLTVSATISSDGAWMEVLLCLDYCVVRHLLDAGIEEWTSAERVASAGLWTRAGITASAMYASYHDVETRGAPDRAQITAALC